MTRDRTSFGRARPNWRYGWWAPSLGLVLLLVAGLIVAFTLTPIKRDPLSPVRADASAAIRALEGGDLPALDEKLAANIGDSDFAYFFTSKVGPRSLGDALATVAGDGKGAGLAAGVNPRAYEILLTDLAGTVALATHGIGDRALPTSWTTEFIEATTTPETLYGKIDRTSDESEKLRVHQDTANKQNLLLLLSRGYWSTGFLQKVTKAYWAFDRDKGDAAWPVTQGGGKYAPAPTGAPPAAKTRRPTYLTDGVLALTAALTANPAASEWAFTDFQPGAAKIEGTDDTVGKFTHYLVFEHRFPTAKGESIGMTATLTALSSAIDAETGATGAPHATTAQSSSPESGPTHDAVVLRTLARELVDGSGCSLHPSDYWNCVKVGAKAVLHWIQQWGHLVLDILALSSEFAPPPFSLVGSAADVMNATWYAIDGDYRMAGLSLAAAVPLLGFVKIARGVKGKVAAAHGVEIARTAEKLAKESADVAKRARAWWLKPWKDCAAVGPGGLSLRYGAGWTKAQRRAADGKVKAYFEAAQAGKLKKTAVPQRSGTLASARYKKAGGSVPDGADVDHTVDLQLGGSDDPANMKPLDATVNKSLGAQVQQQLKALPLDQLISTVAIC